MKKNYLYLSYSSLLLIFNIFIFSSCNEDKIITQEERIYLYENKDITVGVYINYPPFEFLNENGEVDGILLDYFDTLEEKIDHKFKKKFYNDWQALIKDASNQDIDIVLEIQKTKNRISFLTFTEPIFIGNHVIVTKKGTSFNSIEELKGKKVAVCDEYAIQEYLLNNHSDIDLVALTNEEACIKTLNNKDVDAFISLEPSANYFITKLGYEDIIIGKALDYENRLGIGINKNKPVLASIIKKGNEAISFEEKNNILNKWLFNLATPIQNKTTFWRILLYIVTGILSLSFILSYYLKREVEKRTRELNKAKLVAEKSNELKTLFLQNISHEVRTPLNSIIGFSSFLREAENEGIKDQYINTIQKESSNLTNILNNIIEISELTTKKTKPKMQRLALDKELHLLEEVYKAKAKRKGLQFIFNNTIDILESCILTDKSRLIKAISNLLDNALKFTDQGSITLTAHIEKNVLKITVKDTGIGINPSKLNSIFQEFYQEEKELSKKYDGLGIGLSIANENIKSLGGKIVSETSEKKGSIFSIELPVTFATNECNSEAKTIKDKLRILITEDMKLNYLVLEKLLDKTILDNKEIIWAQNGQAAIDLVKKSDFDVIFMDLKMPVVNGYDATKIIKEIKPNIVIIAQTAYAQEEDMNKAKSIGFDAYLTKPIDSNALKITMQDLFQIKTTDDF